MTGQIEDAASGRGERPRAPLRRRAPPTPSASRRSTCSSTRETWDLVQHIDSVLAAAAEGEFRARINPELMQSVIEITTPVCSSAAEVELQLRRLRALRRRDRPPARAAASPRPAPTRSACSSASGSRPRTATALLVDQLQYIARRELIFGMHIHAAVDDPEKAIQVVERPDRAPAGVPRALGQLAVLARRADRPLLLAADGLLGVPPLGRPAPLRELRGLRRGRRAPRADGLHRRLHAHLVGHPAAPAARHGRAADLRRGHAASRTPSRSPPTSRRS